MSSTGNSSSCDKKIRTRVKDVLENYQKYETQQLYEELVKLTREECEKLLKNINGKDNNEKDNNEKGIKGVVQGRTKMYDSLKKKLENLIKDLDDDPDDDLDDDDPNEVPNFGDWVSDGNDIYEHPEMGDLAGIRIGLYFPDDVPRVAKKIEEHFDKKWLFGTVTGERDATKGRNVVIKNHMDGRWYSRGPDGTVEHWEHYGYKSWQVVVEWKEPLAERFKLLRGKMANVGLNSLRVEIQVGTVVTQAWAEVQHNIIYKRPADILATSTMKRIIDAINGLAITTEIMLKELDRSLEDAKKVAEWQGRQVFTCGAEFIGWFQSTYPEERQRWIFSQDLANLLVHKWNLAFVENTDTLWSLPCRNEVKRLIKEKKILLFPKKLPNKIDISIIFVKGLDEGWMNITQEQWNQSRSSLEWRP